MSEERITFTLTEMAVNGRLSAIALVFLIFFPGVQRQQQ
jgi:competence protein ComGC